MMRCSWHGLLSLVLALTFVGSLPAPAPDPDEGAAGEEREANRRLLELWRATEPEHYARLKRDWRSFAALPPEQRDRLRKLDSDLHEDDPTIQRLWIVLDRYTAWLDRLSEEDRQRIKRAADPHEKLQIIRELREREWVSHLPRAVRERVEAAAGAERAALIAESRQRERERRMEWAKAIQPRPLGPRTPAIPIPRLREFYRNELTKEDRQRLQITGLDDPASRERLVQEFVKRHPEESQRLRQNREKKK